MSRRLRAVILTTTAANGDVMALFDTDIKVTDTSARHDIGMVP